MRRILIISAAFVAASALAGEAQPPKPEVIEASETSAKAARFFLMKLDVKDPLGVLVIELRFVRIG
jgi:hypothetical protein